MQEINKEQRAVLNQWIEVGYEIAQHYGFDKSISPFENLDAIYSAWCEDENEKPPADLIVVGLGGVFGNELLHHYKGKWMWVDDEHGEEWGMLISGRCLFPLMSVYNRVHETPDERGFFTQLVAELEQSLPDLRVGISEGHA